MCNFETLNKVWGCNHPDSQLYFVKFEVIRAKYWHVHGHTPDGGYIECATYLHDYEAQRYPLVAGTYHRQ